MNRQVREKRVEKSKKSFTHTKHIFAYNASFGKDVTVLK